MSLLLNNIPSNPAVERFVELSFDISEKIIRLLRKKGLTQHDMAAKLNKKDSEISKWLTGNHNLTLRTIAAIETILEEKLIEIDTELSYTVPANQAISVDLAQQTQVAMMANSGFNYIGSVGDSNELIVLYSHHSYTDNSNISISS